MVVRLLVPLIRLSGGMIIQTRLVTITLEINRRLLTLNRILGVCVLTMIYKEFRAC